MTTVDTRCKQLAEGRLDCATLVAESLGRALDPAGEGKRVFLALDPDRIRAQAALADRIRAQDPARAGALCGMPVAVKDLFDVAGEVTAAGSTCLRAGAPATRDASAVHRLRQAGAVIFGRTNMTEFAYSGVGLNPHYGTPRNPLDDGIARIPGGSSSGAAVAVASGMSVAALGTDTGGSCRIPAALCGIVGFKPTPGRIPLDGVIPLAASFDTVGALAGSVECCARLDGVLAGERDDIPAALPLTSLRFGVPRNHVLDDLEPAVAAAFEHALSSVSEAGAVLTEIRVEAFAGLAELTRHGGMVAAEAYCAHRELLARHAGEFDRRVRLRMELGGKQCPADYLDACRARAAFRAAFDQRTRYFDGLLLPTVPLLAPALAPLEVDDDAFFRTNALLLRNTMIANVAAAPALSLPCGPRDALPVGLMLMLRPGEDRRMFAIARALESLLAGTREGGH